MSTIIKFDLKELRKLANDKNSCIIEKKVTQSLALQPWCLGNLKESIKNLLDDKIGKFDKEFDGILLSYKNLRVLQNVGVIRNDNADIHFQVQADYFVFRPYVGATLKGVVNKKSLTHLGLLVHRVFNVVIPRPTEVPHNKWIGTGIKEGQEVVFRIVVLDLYGALPYIRGELDERWLNLEPNGDEELISTKATEPLNVSYINFDKTKPFIRKQIGDYLPHSSMKKQSNNISSTENSLKIDSTQYISGKSSSTKTKKPSIDNNVAQKTKRKSKTSETEASETTTKLSKKHKKNIL